jgi:hypothetical protein
MSRKHKRRENGPRRIGGTYNRNHPGVKAKRGENRPRMKGLVLIRLRTQAPLQVIPDGAAAAPQGTGVPPRLLRTPAAEPGNLDR